MPIPRFFTSASTSAFLFSIPWTAFAVFWMWGALGFTVSDFSMGSCLFALLGVPFVLIGLVLFCSPLWEYKKATKTVYVISDRRAITFDGGWSTTIRSYPPDRLGDSFRKERSDGTGDVIISWRAWNDSEGDRQVDALGFIDIPNPREIERMLNGLAGG